MNEELQKQLAELLAGLMSVASDAKQFAQQQIPPLVQEKIMLGRFEETVMFVVPLACSAVFVWVIVKKLMPLESDDGMPPIFSGVFGGFGVVFMTGLGVSHFHNFAAAWFAPRLYIVEWLGSMVSR